MTTLFLAIASLFWAHPHHPTQDQKAEVTVEEALEFALKLEREMSSGHVSVLDDELDAEGLMEEAALDLELTPRQKAGFLRGFRKGSLGQKITSPAGASFRFLRVVPGGSRVLFRHWAAQGMDYKEISLKKGKNGIKIADILFYSTGESLRAIMRRSLIALAAADPEQRTRMHGWALDWANSLDLVLEFTKEANSGDSAKALALFNKLPKSVRQDRSIQLIRLTAAMKTSNMEYLKAEEEFSRLHPNGVFKDMASFGTLLIRKEFKRALDAVDNIDRHVGGDPMLDLLRGRAYLGQGDYPKAKELGARAVKGEPHLRDPLIFLVTVSLKEKAFGQTVKLLEELEKNFGVRFEGYESNDVYSEFVKSQEYRDWMKSRGK